MTIKCADCGRVIKYSQAVFRLGYGAYHSVDIHVEPKIFYICQQCAQKKDKGLKKLLASIIKEGRGY